MKTEGEFRIGVLGGGQLGRMLSLDARRMGYKVLTWTGGDRSGAAATADQLLDEPFDDQAALKKFTDKEVLSADFQKQILFHFKAIRPFFDYMSNVLTTDLNGVSLL